MYIYVYYVYYVYKYNIISYNIYMCVCVSREYDVGVQHTTTHSGASRSYNQPPESLLGKTLRFC